MSKLLIVKAVTYGEVLWDVFSTHKKKMELIIKILFLNEKNEGLKIPHKTNFSFKNYPLQSEIV